MKMGQEQRNTKNEKKKKKLEALATDKPTLKEKPVLVEKKMSNEYKMVSGQDKTNGIGDRENKT